MRIFYYKTIHGFGYWAVGNGMPSDKSVIWQEPSVSTWIVPGTYDD